MDMVTDADTDMGMAMEKNRRKRTVEIYTFMKEIKEILDEGKDVPLVVTGNSMSPFLVHERDKIMIRKAEGRLKKGDMVFFRRVTGQYVMHRICRVDRQGGYYMIGDAQQQIEGPVSRNQIFGKIIAVCRKGKWIRKRNFWWEFFEHIWIRIIPLRPILCYLYRKIPFNSTNCLL